MNRLSQVIGRRRRLSCRQVGEMLQSYLDAELDDLSTRRITNHLDDCRRCGMEHAVYRSIKTSLQREGDVDREALARLRRFSEQLAQGGLPDEPLDGDARG